MERSSLFAQRRPQGVALRFHPLLNRESLLHWHILDLQGWYSDYLTYDILRVFLSQSNPALGACAW
jgi:hypothetical protein